VALRNRMHMPKLNRFQQGGENAGRVAVIHRSNAPKIQWTLNSPEGRPTALSPQEVFEVGAPILSGRRIGTPGERDNPQYCDRI
jgi:hypothetical protein